MFKLAILTISLGACATTATGVSDREAAPRTGIQLDLTAHSTDATAAFPAALDPAVPSIDRMQHALRARYGSTTMTAELDLCVAPDGHVTKISLAQGSTYDVFDHALLRDAAAWQFATLPGPATVESCRRASVTYRTR